MKAKADAKFFIGAKAIIIDKQKRILLLKTVKRKKTIIDSNAEYWDFPGGKLLPGESAENALIREVNEEIRQETIIDGLFDVAIANFKYTTEKDLFLFLVLYKCHLADEKNFNLSREHRQWEWVPIADAKKRLLHKYPEAFVRNLDRL